MTVSTIDPRTALVVIDLQLGILAMSLDSPVADVLSRAVALAEAFRAHDLPVVLVNVAGAAPGRSELARPTTPFPSDWTELAPELAKRPTDHLVTKRTWGAFTNTDLEVYLKSREVTQIVLAGVATSIGVESTARQAFELGFNVALAIDAMADRNADAHLNSVKRIFPRLGETGTTAEIIDVLAKSRGL